MRQYLNRRALPLAVLVLTFSTWAVAVQNGTLDGNAHPAIGSLQASVGSDPCPLSNQADPECSAVLIAPDLLLTTAECGNILRDALAAGSVDHVWVDFNPDSTLDCADFVAVDGSQIFVDPAFDPKREDAANAAVLRLVAPLSTTPAALPTAGRIGTLPESQSYTVVSYGELHPFGSSFLTDIKRRSASASFQGLSSEILTLHLDTGPGSNNPCVAYSDRGGAAFLNGTNEAVALVVPSNEGLGCTSQSRYQRLDVPSVRNFLAGFVTLP